MNDLYNIPLISIVLPIYNVRLYLAQCLDSIINQTYSKLEVILVDDGSTDGSHEICEEYKNRDKRIVLIHKENEGVSSARNAGLRAIKGQYMTFIDPDDIVAPDYVETLYNAMIKTKSDISICGVKTVYSEKYCEADATNRKVEVYIPQCAIEKMLYQNEIDVNAWGKMYLSSLFDGIYYPVGKINEDTATTYKVIARANKIVFDSYKCYFYIQRMGSIMHQKFAIRKMTLIDFSDECLQFVRINFPEIENSAICKYVTDCFVLICKIYECKPTNKECLEKCRKIIKKYRMIVILDPKSRKKTKIACLSSFLGFRFVAYSKRLNSYRDKKKGIRDI